MAIATISPVTGETLRSFDELTPEELNLEHEADSVSALITSEMGKTLRAAHEEVAKCVNAKTVWIGEDAGA